MLRSLVLAAVLMCAAVSSSIAADITVLKHSLRHDRQIGSWTLTLVIKNTSGRTIDGLVIGDFTLYDADDDLLEVRYGNVLTHTWSAGQQRTMQIATYFSFETYTVLFHTMDGRQTFSHAYAE